MTERNDDGPWNFRSDHLEMPNADRPLPGRVGKIRAGTRIKERDPQHRTKGAKGSTERKISQGNSFQRPDAGTKKRKPSEERKRAKRRMRREMERREAAIAPALKNPTMEPSGTFLATDYVDRRKAAMDAYPRSEAIEGSPWCPTEGK